MPSEHRKFNGKSYSLVKKWLRTKKGAELEAKKYRESGRHGHLCRVVEDPNMGYHVYARDKSLK